MTDLEYVVDEVLDEGLDDWVPIDTLVWCAREAAEKSKSDYKRLALDSLNFLLAEELAEVGDLGESGFEAWPTSPTETIERIVRELDKVDWQPFGGLCWVSATSKGKRRVQQEPGM